MSHIHGLHKLEERSYAEDSRNVGEGKSGEVIGALSRYAVGFYRSGVLCKMGGWRIF